MNRWLIGGYGPDMNGGGSGIYGAVPRENGALELLGLVTPAQSPSFLARRGAHVYAAIEGGHRVESFLESGSIESGSILLRDGSVSSGGTWPCQLAFAGEVIVASNYLDGALGVIRLDDDVVAELTQSIQGEGSGPFYEQAGPHAHASFLVDPETLLSLDLGADRIHIHAVTGTSITRTGSVALNPGSTPRDIARHSSGRLYVVGELSGQLMVFSWESGMLAAEASVPLPGFVAGDHASAISFAGEFTYVGIRGSNRIAVLHCTGTVAPEPVGWVSSEGNWPRHHAAVGAVPGGAVLHVANQRSNSVASFALGPDGMPSLIADPIDVPAPTFLLGASQA